MTLSLLMSLSLMSLSLMSLSTALAQPALPPSLRLPPPVSQSALLDSIAGTLAADPSKVVAAREVTLLRWPDAGLEIATVPADTALTIVTSTATHHRVLRGVDFGWVPLDAVKTP